MTRHNTHTSSVFSTRGAEALLGHGDEIQSSIETAWQGREVNIKGKLISDELEHLVVVGILHQIKARANVGRVLALGDELQRERVGTSGYAVCSTVISALNLAILGAAGVVGASSRVPLVSIVAVGVAALYVEPSPVRVDHNLSIHVRATGSTLASATLPRHLWVSLGLLGADQLATGGGGEKGRKGREDGRRHHDGSLVQKD